MKHALSLLAVTALGGAASADTSPSTQVVAVRTLATGSPACGNVMLKYTTEDPACSAIRGLRALGRKLAAELEKLAPTRQGMSSLTLPAAPRPGL
jgi:hypothetical protein